MSTFDYIIIGILLLFVYSGFVSGFVKKIVGIACLALALVLATKFSADVAESIFQPMGLEGRLAFFSSFLLIVIGIMLTQAIIYKVLVKDLVDNVWNRIGGMLLSLFEGSLMISIALIIISIYFKLPSNETKSDSVLYKPLKNFAPYVYDSLNTFLPESEDFYQQIFQNISAQAKKLEQRIK